MNREELEKLIAGEMALFEEEGCSTTIRLLLSDGKTVDIWYFEEMECYVWTNGKEGFEDYGSLTADIVGWLERNGLSVVRAENI